MRGSHPKGWLPFFWENILDRYAVFIDGGYLRKCQKKYSDPKIDFKILSEIVAKHDERFRTYYYDCPPYVSDPPTESEKSRQAGFDRFKRALENIPRFQVRLGRLAYRPERQERNFEQKKVDVLLAVDLVRNSCEKHINRAILFACDSDFVPAIEVARTAGVIVELYYCPELAIHDELIRACDDWHYIDNDFFNSIRIRS